MVQMAWGGQFHGESIMDPVVWWDIQKELVTYLAKKKKCSLVSSEDVKISHFLVHSRFSESQTEVECTCSVPPVPCSVHCMYTASIIVHCTYTATKWQCICSVHAAYIAARLPVHSTSVWGVVIDI